MILIFKMWLGLLLRDFIQESRVHVGKVRLWISTLTKGRRRKKNNKEKQKQNAKKKDPIAHSQPNHVTELHHPSAKPTKLNANSSFVRSNAANECATNHASALPYRSHRPHGGAGEDDPGRDSPCTDSTKKLASNGDPGNMGPSAISYIGREPCF